ncbi:DEAD/DEAH box helicase [Oceanivirga miroungae]|uniref:RNA helicase n=1 Tax=Oceanivirga miroungae TaxID=1130046 RepID=A0A6I8M673_9FUSO|nr:DEAD/DEAH box helicase [Oceanivirga miroungae]VWL85389.1 DEAD/DEAH box helicase [Oceanivirga miroungae]
MTKTFEELGLSKNTLEAIEKKGFTTPSEIQALVIPELLKEKTHLIGQAQTGTGKTAAFGLPIIELLNPNKNVKAIVLTPTRELAVQVSEELYSLKGKKDIRVLAVYGGASIEKQLKSLKKGVDIVVGTPGRVMDMMRKKALKLDELEYFILDEADEMLNMGFIDDIKEILKETNKEKKMLFFSATMPKEIINIAKEFMPSYKKLVVEKNELTTNLTEQIYFEVRLDDKFEALCRVLDSKPDFYGIVFCRTKHDVDEITKKLKARSYDTEAIHGDITQAQREKTLDLFKNKILNVLVATDVAARGIDVSDLTHVINYSIPQEAESYVHRIGRTGRAGKKGIAITFVTPREANMLAKIRRITNSDIRREKIPNVKDILEAKKEYLLANVDEIIMEGDYTTYLDLSRKMLKNKNADVVLAAFLRHVYDDEFSQDKYNEIKDVTVKIDDSTRLFIAMGARDKLSVKKLLELINKKAKVPGRKVKDIKIMENFSFISVPLKEAEDIMNAFNKDTTKKPLVEISTGGKNGSKSSDKGRKRRRR